ncbi:MAG: hypothetical protein WBQ32_13935 [Ignavibacteriaceae bacterium]
MMHKIIIPILTILALTLYGCGSGDNEVDSSKLRTLITEAIAGDQDANESLEGLLSSKHAGKNDYNQLTIDGFKLNDKQYYSVLLEYPDPTLNLFAIYDSEFNFFLLDKSLNGNLSVEWATSGSRLFVFLQERFLTKDVLSIDRLSIYEVFDETASLIYRSLSRFVQDNQISYQTVELISNTFISTKVGGLKDKAIDNQTDTFYFNSDTKKYLSKWNLFNKYVKQQIREFSWVTVKPQIPSDMLEAGNTLIRPGYRIDLGSDWEEIPSFSEDKLLLKSLVGTKFINRSLNSGFTILEIPQGENAENYSPYSFEKPTRGDYQIRATAIYDSGSNYSQILEHKCGSKKFLLLFECPKTIYTQNKKIFDQIISSFTIKC